VTYVIEYLPEAFYYEKENKKLMNYLMRIEDRKKIVSLNTPLLASIPIFLKAMLFETLHDFPDKNLLLKIKLLEILFLLKRFFTQKSKASSFVSSTGAGKMRATEKRVHDIIDYINNNYYNKLTLNELAEMSFLSKRQFTRIFKKITDMTFKSYINKIRINKAMQLLSDKDKEIISICFEVGFDDLSYFYKVFKNETGVTPKSFMSSVG